LSDYYQEILNKLYEFIRVKGRASFEELLRWAGKHEVGTMTLSIALNDLMESGKIRAIGELFEPEDLLVAYPVPRMVESVSEEAEEIEERVEAAREKVEKRIEEAPTEFGELSSSVEVKAKVVEEEPGAKDRMRITEDDLNKAIEYLNDYWSVGVIRFMQDLKLLGVSKPDAVLRKLIELGYVNYSPMGVVNATDKLPKIRRPRKLIEFV